MQQRDPLHFLKLRGQAMAIALSGLAALALVVNAAVAVIDLRRVVEAEAWVNHTHEVLEQLQAFDGAFDDVERVQRGYLLTRDEAYRTSFERARQDVELHLRRLDALLRDTPAQQARLTALRPMMAQRLDVLQRGVELRDGPDGLARALALVRSGWDKALTDQVQTKLDEIASEEEARLVERSRASAEAWRIGLIAILLGLAAGLGLLAAAIHAFRGRLRERGLAAARLHEEKERLRATEGELARRAELLEQQDRRKDEFLAVLSHELRNPLAAVRNGMAVLARAAPGSEPARRAREIVARQSGHLTRMVDDLLDVSRIASGKIRIERRRLDLAAVVRLAIEDARPAFEARRLALAVRGGAQPVWVDGDATRLAQVTTNLLNNAAKFTEPGGRVAVEIGAEGGRAVLRVRDSGAGMDSAFLARLFQPFVQAEETIHRTAGGLGLGLAIARSIVELHGGTIAAASAGPGKGAELEVRLPLLDAAPADAAAPSPARRAAEGAVRVLVIEDNEDSAESLRDILELHGHEVSVAHDGPEGLARARAAEPDVVLCDVGIPGLDGYEVARRLRADGTRARLVALTGYAGAEDVARAHQAGFDAHLAKPPDLDRLARLLAPLEGGAGHGSA